MSTLSKTNVHRIDEIKSHPNADTLQIINIDGFSIVVKCGLWQVGDLCVWIKPDMFYYGNNIPELDFIESNSRIKSVKLRGIVSNGILVKPREGMLEGEEVSSIYKVKPYVQEPTYGDKPQVISNAPKGECGYTDIQSLRKYHNQFTLGESVVVEEKIHGANFRAVYQDGTLYIGTHRQWLLPADTQIWRTANHYDLAQKLANVPNKILFGELYGYVQDLRYGHEKGEASIRFFDIFDISQGKYLDYDDRNVILDRLELMAAPLLYTGEWRGLDDHKHLAEGPSTIADHIKEGFVIRPTVERYNDYVGRMILKLHGDGYLSRKGKKEQKEVA